MSSPLIFVYDGTVQPVKNDTFTKANLDAQILKSTNDVNQVKNGDLESSLNYILTSGKAMGDTPAESYRKEFRHDLDFYHKGYLWYLYASYKHDHGIEVAPWYLWNVIAHQVAQIVKDGGDKYREVFTKSADKICIPIYDNDIDISLFTRSVKKMLPDPETYEAFFPNWEPFKLPMYYQQAMEGLFADMVQRFYSCAIFSCCLPKVRVLGDADDWKILHDAVCHLKTIIPDPYLDQVSAYTSRLVTGWNDAETWRNFFSIGHCGSGHQECIEGDIRNLINRGLGGEFLSEQLPSTLSRFPFENHVIPSQRDSAFLAGVVGSVIDSEGFLVPVYDFAITYVDQQRLVVDNTEVDNITRFMQQLESLHRLTTTSLKSHFTYHQKKREIPHDMILHESQRKTLAEGSEAWEKYLTKMYKYQSKSYHYMKQFSSADIGGYNDYLPTFDEFKADYQRRIERGTEEEYVKVLEMERLTKLQTSYNVWFQHQLHITNPTWFADCSDATLSYEQYQSQRSIASMYYESIATADGMHKFLEDAQRYSTMTHNRIDTLSIIIHTLDLDVWQLYFNCLDEKERLHAVKVIGIEYLHIIPSNTSFNDTLRYQFDLDPQLKSYISQQFLLYFDRDLRAAVTSMWEESLGRLLQSRGKNWHRQSDEDEILKFMKDSNDVLPQTFTSLHFDQLA